MGSEKRWEWGEGGEGGGGGNACHNRCTNDLSYFTEGKDCGARGISLRIDDNEEDGGYARKREIHPQTPSVAARTSSSLSSLRLTEKQGGWP
jgi:hypothetical protein